METTQLHNATQENGQPACQSILGIAQCSRHADTGNLGADRSGTGGKTVGKDKGHNEGDGQGTGKVADEDQSPIAQYLL